MTESTLSRHEVSFEDAQRLNRLSEEIRSRLTEVAFIVSRISGTDYTGGGVKRFVPREAAKIVEPTASGAGSAAAGFDWLEVVEIFPGFVCCYGSVGGQTVLDCPCAPFF